MKPRFLSSPLSVFLLVALALVHFTQADATTDCLNACNQNDVICRAKCVPVPFGGVDSVTNTGNCIATCQTNFPKDPSAQSNCYTSCFQGFVNPPPHLQPPPAPSPTLPEPEPQSTSSPKPTETEGNSSESNSRPTGYTESSSSTLSKLSFSSVLVLVLVLNWV